MPGEPARGVRADRRCVDGPAACLASPPRSPAVGGWSYLKMPKLPSSTQRMMKMMTVLKQPHPIFLAP